jgi:hypothetical protein
VEELGIPIFPDDTNEVALTKVALAIATKTEDSDLAKYLPYAWSGSKPVRFNDFEHPVNPWLASQEKGRQVQYNNSGLFGQYNDLNVVFYKDLSSPVYFPDVPSYTISNTFANLQKEAVSLGKLFSAAPALPPITYTKAMFSSAKPVTTMLITTIFQKLNASKFIPFIQLVADDYNIQYKVLKTHSIAKNLLAQWTSYERVSRNPALVCMLPIPSTKNSYCRLSIDNSGMLTLRFVADSRENMTWTAVESHMNTIKQYLRSLLKSGKRVSLEQTSVSARAEIENTTLSLNDVAQLMSKLPSIYHILKRSTQEGYVTSVYKRSTNYKSKMDISDFIASRLDLGIPIDEVMQDLVDLGLSKEEIEIWIQQYNNKNVLQESAQPVQRKVLGNNGSIVKITKAAFAYKLSIENVATLWELKRAITWMKGVLSVAIQKQKDPIVKKVATKRQPPPKEPSPPPAPKNDDDLLLEEGLDFSGGSEKIDRYLLSRLQKADPSIFVDTKNYPRKCAANNFRQPLVLSDEEKAHIDVSGYSDGYDNIVKFGSDAAHQNSYICPRIWCPISKVPLTAEKFKKDGCPNPDEKAIKMFEDDYWDNNVDSPHYIGFLKDRAPNGACLPCCMKKKLKDTKLAECVAPPSVKKPSKAEAANDVAQPEKKETYIMAAPAPIPEGRFGIIPKDLHDFLLPSISYQQYFSRNLTVPKYFVRQGIKHGNDSIMAAVATILNKKSKQELMQDIIKRLDPLRFLSLGFVATFSPTEPIVPTPKLLKAWKSWLTGFPRYAKLIKDNNVSRELAVYQSWKHFIAYLQNTDFKVPQYVIRLVEVLYDTTIILWHKKDNQNATLRCAVHNSISSEIGMLFEENGYYEPLELRIKNKSRHNRVATDEFPQLLKLSATCPDSYDDSDVTEKLRGLVAWIDTILTQPDSFRLKTLVLRQDLSVHSLLLKSGITITLPENISERSLTTLDAVLRPHLARMLYIEDIAGNVLEPQNVWKQDYNMLVFKLQQLGFGMNGGVIKVNGAVFSSLVRIPDVNTAVSPIFLLADTTIFDDLEKINGKERRWHHTALALGKHILQHNVFDKGRLLKSTAAFVATNKNMVEALLEEMPLHLGAAGVRQWLYNIDLEERARLTTLSKPIIDKHQYIFSQAAVDEGLPPDVFQPPKVIRPREEFDLPIVVPAQQDVPAARSSIKKPKLLNASDVKSLPSKFTQIKNYSWTNYKIVDADYTDKAFIELLAYMSQYLRIPVSYEEVQLTRARIIKTHLKSKTDSEVVFNDPSMMAAWSAHFKKKYPKGFDELWAKELQNMGYTSRLEIWEKIALSADSNLKPMEIDLYVLASLLGVSILVIHRSKYGVKAAARRGDLEDLSVSCTFFTPKHGSWKERPVCMFFKEQTTTVTDFKCIIDSEKCFIQNVATIPRDIMQVLEHLNDKKNTEYKA